MCETQNNIRAFKNNSKEKVCLFKKQANIHLFCEIHEKILALVVQYRLDNRPFPNYLWPLFQSESWCSSFHMKISFHLHVNQN